MDMEDVSSYESQDLKNMESAPFKRREKNFFGGEEGVYQLRKTLAIIHPWNAAQKIPL